MDPVALVDVYDQHGRLHQRQRLTGAGSQCCIGRSLDCDIVIDDSHAAGRHALLVLQEDGRLLVRDLGTRNGTQVDGAGCRRCRDPSVRELRAAARSCDSNPRVAAAAGALRRDLLRRYRTMLATRRCCARLAVLSQWLGTGRRSARMLIGCS
jgi:hypothetical protein